MTHHGLSRRVFVAALLAALASGIPAQDEAAATTPFAPDQVEQLVAPIALYPDALVGQILMASTYPLEIVAADRWLGGMAGADVTTIDEGLKAEDFDPSVKSVVKVPDVLKWMAQNADWTRDLGDAFLGQQNEVMAAIQKMRSAAHAAGNLQSTEQQTVTVESDGTIVIEQVNPEVLYVPEYGTEVYADSWTYGSAWYPYMYRPGAGLIRFGLGLAIGHALWGHCDWRGKNVDIDVNRYNSFNQFTTRDFQPVGGSRQNWRHDAAHREGVRYRDPAIAATYRQPGTNDRARGRAPAPTDRGGAPQPAAHDRTPPADGARQVGRADQGQRPQDPRFDGNGGLSGASTPQTDRASSERGRQSRGCTPAGGAPPRGGGARGGGGGRRR